MTCDAKFVFCSLSILYLQPPSFKFFLSKFFFFLYLSPSASEMINSGPASSGGNSKVKRRQSFKAKRCQVSVNAANGAKSCREVAQ